MTRNRFAAAGTIAFLALLTIFTAPRHTEPMSILGKDSLFESSAGIPAAAPEVAPRGTSFPKNLERRG